MLEADEWDQETFDQYVSSEVILPHGGTEKIGKVISCKGVHNGNPIGRANAKPIFDTRIYEVRFLNGHAAEYSANFIA